MIINVSEIEPSQLNRTIKAVEGDCTLTGCLGNRFIAAGVGEKHITIEGIPGNALGAFLNGATIDVMGNAQDAVGDTMNAGRIIIHGNVGDTAGYAMRGGEIYVKGNAGYRAGVHMKAYGDKRPVLVIGGRAGSFLGEYLAGGLILVLGQDMEEVSPIMAAARPAGASSERPVVGNFCCTGMHGGKVVLRGKVEDFRFPEQVSAREATAEDRAEIEPYIRNYGAFYGVEVEELLSATYTVATPSSGNPYTKFYVAN